MFKIRTAKESALDEAIDEALRELKGHEAHSDEYAVVIDQLAKLHSMKEVEKPNRISKDTLALVLGNLAGILVIVGYEQKHVIASKALPFVGKVK